MIILRDYFYIKSTPHKEGDEMRLIQARYHGTSIISIDDIFCFGEVGCMTKNMTGDKLGGLALSRGFAELQPFVALFFRDYFCNYSIF